MKNKNILIVEDSKSILNTLSSLIGNELGCNCVTASTMKETAELLLKYKGKFDVALLDLSLPDSPNGEIVDFVTKFKIPTLILTGSQVKEDESKFRDKNIVDYVIKDGMYSFNYALSVVKRIILNSEIKILIVDDSKTFLATTKDLLDRYRLNTYTALNGKEALDIIKKEEDIKIVLTDFNMPEMDGLELTRNIRKSYSKDEISIIVTSSSDDKSTPAKFLKYGANDFIHKGFSQEEFFVRINANLEILELFQEAKDKANKDYLTGMFNRRYLFDEGNEVFERIKHRKDDKLAVAIIDIDKFKSINDTYGHDIGDIAIKEVPRILSSKISSNSLIARLGGEEFCILLKGRELDEVKKAFEEVRDSFEQNVIETEKCDLKFTVSIGVCLKMQDNLTSMINKADEALYEAKETGRNKVVYFES